MKEKPAKLLGYKVTNHDRSRRVGIAAYSLKDLSDKTKIKFNLTSSWKLYLASDASEVEDEDYFNTLKEQTLFLVVEESQKVISDYDLVLSALNNDVFEAGKVIKDFVENSADKDQVFGILLKVKNEAKEKTEISSKDKHEDWFQGHDAQCNTKEEVMRRRSQDRIRGYFYKLRDEIVHTELYRTNAKAKSLLQKSIEYFKYLLTANDYFSCMFDRSYPDKLETDETDATRILSKRRKLEIKEFLAKDTFLDMTDLRKSLCSDVGVFQCYGPWFQHSCTYSNHLINPYVSRENLILFQTWNLDHQIEFSRTALPSLLKNVTLIVDGKAICRIHKSQAVQISVLTYFKEFFTLSNLKLVHIICHDKGSHELKSNGGVLCSKCDEYKFLMRLQGLIDKN